ncbi:MULTISPECIES: hypothetical protein [Streptococcus]|jgi:hypothetical protein|uniref:Uncharacterized protein n=1 Tax=Streptococcus mitis TaxID=28037 RepID=A0A1X1KM31_STRMT|nr:MULTISPECIES: hypothetical protein [Streptococcus]MBR9644795.1 hypothetical protein [Streptococcus sp. 11-4097]MDB0074599.1 hypothetical protein [Streptococcus gwangjuense]ORP00485.1 hypothetical protein B7696_02450 [Streptococcus mitis]
MAYKSVIEELYCKLLGQSIHKRLKELQILQNQIGYETPEGELELLSETTVGQIIKGKRNISFNASLAFQTSLDYKNPRELFFPSIEFELLLIENIISTILIDPTFENTFLKKLIAKKFSNVSKKEVAQIIEKNKEIFLDSLSSFISDFPEEETSHQIAEKLTYWLSELACLIPKI